MSDDKLDDLITSPTYRLWVEGTRLISPLDDESRSHADALAHAATALGLLVFRQPVVAEETSATPRRRWTLRRVSLDEVRRYVEARPGIKFVDLVEELYAEPPWTDAKQRQAKGKLRTTLARLRLAGFLAKRFDRDGHERWQPTNVATGLVASQAGPVAEVLSEAHLPRAPLLADQIRAGTAILREAGVLADERVRDDPNFYPDLLAALLRAITQPPET